MANYSAIKIGFPSAYILGSCRKFPFCMLSAETATVLQKIVGLPVELVIYPGSFDDILTLLMSRKLDISTPVFRPDPHRLRAGISVVPVVSTEVFGKFLFKDAYSFGNPTINFVDVFSLRIWLMFLLSGCIMYLPASQSSKAKLTVSLVLGFFFFLYQTFVLFSMVLKSGLPFETYERAETHIKAKNFSPVVLKGSSVIDELINSVHISKQQVVEADSYDEIIKLIKHKQKHFLFGSNHQVLNLVKHYKQLTLSSHILRMARPWLSSLILHTNPFKAVITRAYLVMQQHGLFEPPIIRMFHTDETRMQFQPQSTALPITLGPDWWYFLAFPLPGLVTLFLEFFVLKLQRFRWLSRTAHQ